MTVLYCLYRKSCNTKTSYLPIKASGQHEIFNAPLYLQHVSRYKRTVQAAVRFTLSRVKHISSLFQHKDGLWAYGDIYTENSALLVRIENSEMEVFVFPGQLPMAETFYRSVSKLPLEEIRRMAKPVMKDKYSKQLLCYSGRQLEFA